MDEIKREMESNGDEGEVREGRVKKKAQEHERGLAG